MRENTYYLPLNL